MIHVDKGVREGDNEELILAARGCRDDLAVAAHQLGVPLHREGSGLGLALFIEGDVDELAALYGDSDG